MSKRDQRRVVELQQQVRLAKRALERILYSRDPNLAEDALEQLRMMDEPCQLQGLLGHASRKETENDLR